MDWEIKRDLLEYSTMPHYEIVHRKTGKPIKWIYDSLDDEYGHPDHRYKVTNIVQKCVDEGGRYYASGLIHYFIEGREVTKEEFVAHITNAGIGLSP